MGPQLSRTQHQAEAALFLQRHLKDSDWEITLPPYGTGQETYIAQSEQQTCFIKLGAHLSRYKVMSGLGLSPTVITAGQLEDGTSILVQKHIAGRKPSRTDFRQYADKFANALRLTHHSDALKEILPERSSQTHREAGLAQLKDVEQRWERYKAHVPSHAAYIDEKIEFLKEQAAQFTSSGLAASHNDVCNGNWLVAEDETVYLLDYESMSLDDPAFDLGAILWWYYPPETRSQFIETAGYKCDAEFQHRMQIRMAIHNLNIILPRKNSFDRFTAERFEDILTDFRAVVEGRENPQGYFD